VKFDFSSKKGKPKEAIGGMFAVAPKKPVPIPKLKSANHGDEQLRSNPVRLLCKSSFNENKLLAKSMSSSRIAQIHEEDKQEESKHEESKVTKKSKFKKFKEKAKLKIQLDHEDKRAYTQEKNMNI